MNAILSPLPSPHPGLGSSTHRTRTWNVLPFPKPVETTTVPPRRKPLPAWPSPGDTKPAASFPSAWPSPLTALPTPGPRSTENRELDFAAADLPRFPVPATTAPSAESTAAPRPVSPRKSPPTVEEPDFTDDDLREAFGPIVEASVRNAAYGGQSGIDTHLEPMLRAIIRRALAEYSPAGRPFEAPGSLDRFVWHVQALFTSRTYEDIIFEKTRRFQVEEVFLLDQATLALVSFASCDPARHASARRVGPTAQRLALKLRGEKDRLVTEFPLSDGRGVISFQGRHAILMALVRGPAGELVKADLEFALRRIEDHFREEFRDPGSSLLFALQPFLEDCLLIQSPASAA